MMRWILTVEINEAPCPDSVVIADPSLDQRAWRCLAESLDPGANAENVIGPDLHLRYVTAQIGVVIRR